MSSPTENGDTLFRCFQEGLNRILPLMKNYCLLKSGILIKSGIVSLSNDKLNSLTTLIVLSPMGTNNSTICFYLADVK